MLAFSLVLAAIAGTAQVSVLRRIPSLGLFIAAVTAAFTWHLIADYGFLRDGSGASIVAGRYVAYRIPEIAISKVEALSGTDGVSIIDARLTTDYQKSHIPGAMSLPITTTYGGIRGAVATMPKKNRVIVYCQSNQCSWSDEIARQLAAHDYNKVYIFRGGMRAWDEAHPHTSTAIQ